MEFQRHIISNRMEHCPKLYNHLVYTYTGFLMRNYDQIAEDASRGQGFFIEALASYHGCSIQGVETFKSVVQNNFIELFESKDSNGAALDLGLKNVLNRYPMLREKCLILSDSSYS